MPGPSPGMAPYPEDPDPWPGLHQGFVTFPWEALDERPPERDVASLNGRLSVDDPNRAIVPDAAALERSSPGGRPGGNPAAAGGVAVLDAPRVPQAPAAAR